ncbi:hypothetical protein [Streptococcus suis]|uniref:hypothetical protein n=1 Tax=Streptococcus suis TaxID=1307 RepID=UPI0028A916F0|nr:hypothetical protein [Streptococcus suis]MDW8648929.1 hypothetical protein [Streptococcus suis]WNN04014.1 hypothetical protein RMQ63_02535 [Streptococcus suis]WNO80037.1 hypothetical protein RMP65_07160 [Streptococcus suis]
MAVSTEVVTESVDAVVVSLVAVSTVGVVSIITVSAVPSVVSVATSDAIVVSSARTVSSKARPPPRTVPAAITPRRILAESEIPEFTAYSSTSLADRLNLIKPI